MPPPLRERGEREARHRDRRARRASVADHRGCAFQIGVAGFGMSTIVATNEIERRSRALTLEGYGRYGRGALRAHIVSRTASHADQPDAARPLSRTELDVKTRSRALPDQHDERKKSG